MTADGDVGTRVTVTWQAEKWERTVTNTQVVNIMESDFRDNHSNFLIINFRSPVFGVLSLGPPRPSSNPA